MFVSQKKYTKLIPSNVYRLENYTDVLLPKRKIEISNKTLQNETVTCLCRWRFYGYLYIFVLYWNMTTWAFMIKLRGFHCFFKYFWNLFGVPKIIIEIHKTVYFKITIVFWKINKITIIWLFYSKKVTMQKHINFTCFAVFFLYKRTVITRARIITM